MHVTSTPFGHRACFQSETKRLARIFVPKTLLMLATNVGSFIYCIEKPNKIAMQICGAAFWGKTTIPSNRNPASGSKAVLAPVFSTLLGDSEVFPDDLAGTTVMDEQGCKAMPVMPYILIENRNQTR